MDTATHRILVQSEEHYASSVGPLEQAQSAFHLSQWLIESGMLRRADQIARATWNHALESLRLSEGMPVREVVQLVDAAAFVLVELRALTEGADGVRQTLDDLVALHERFHHRLEVFNRLSVIPVDGPQGPVNPEELLRGRASAMHALLAGNPSKALEIMEKTLGDWTGEARGSFYLKAVALTVRCLIALGERMDARRLLDGLADKSSDWESLRCEIGDLYAQTYVGTGEEHHALNALDELLHSASQAGLALRWTDLMCTRAELLEASGAVDDARAFLRVALFGPREQADIERWPQAASFPLPSKEGYRLAFLRAQRILVSPSDKLMTLVDEVLCNLVPPKIPKRSKYRGRQMPPRVEGDDARRAQLHEQALAVLREFEEHGKQFVLYLRKFDVTVLHRAALLGPGLLEVGLYDLLPESCNMLTIQNPTESIGYTGDASAFDRTVPALNLADDNWEEVARFLIANAKAIVSECLMLTEGVRKELEMIDELGRNEDALLVIPGAGSLLERIDDDPLIRRFATRVSAEVLSDVDLSAIPFFARILDDL
jgi:hypothetical protein